jgi:hypothetical protein
MQMSEFNHKVPHGVPRTVLDIDVRLICVCLPFLNIPIRPIGSCSLKHLPCHWLVLEDRKSQAPIVANLPGSVVRTISVLFVIGL